MIKEKSIKNYVCPVCFRSIDKCICKLVPYELIMIDYNLQNVIEQLNTKGYSTRFCCEGHSTDGTPNLYIFFDRPIIDAPMGFTLEHKTTIRYFYKNKNDKTEFEKEKNEIIKTLTEWVNKLPYKTKS